MDSGTQAPAKQRLQLDTESKVFYLALDQDTQVDYHQGWGGLQNSLPLESPLGCNPAAEVRIYPVSFQLRRLVHNANVTYSADNTQQKVCPAENGEYPSFTRGWSSNFGLPCNTCHSHAYRRMQKKSSTKAKEFNLKSEIPR